MKVKWYNPASGKVFVFGSNLAGAHGGGAALEALNYGAVYGQGTGRQGDTYAIPTKDARIRTLPLNRIKDHVDEFLDYAAQHPDTEFFLTRVGCGLAGYEDEDIAPLFADAPPNVEKPEGW
jgi:hypothetical protein